MNDGLHPKDREELESLGVGSLSARCGESAVSAPLLLPHASAGANATPSRTAHESGAGELDSPGATYREDGAMVARRPHKPETARSDSGPRNQDDEAVSGELSAISGVIDAGGRGLVVAGQPGETRAEPGVVSSDQAARSAFTVAMDQPALLRFCSRESVLREVLEEPIPVPIRRALGLVSAANAQADDITEPLKRVVRLAQQVGLADVSVKVCDLVAALAYIHDLEGTP